jgi:hypothetical protein
LLFILEMQLHQRRANLRKPPKLRRYRNPRQLPLQIRRIRRPVLRMMQQPIGVVKDIPLGNLLITIMLPKLRQRPVSNVLPPIRAVFVV